MFLSFFILCLNRIHFRGLNVYKTKCCHLDFCLCNYRKEFACLGAELLTQMREAACLPWADTGTRMCVRTRLPTDKPPAVLPRFFPPPKPFLNAPVSERSQIPSPSCRGSLVSLFPCAKAVHDSLAAQTSPPTPSQRSPSALPVVLGRRAGTNQS